MYNLISLHILTDASSFTLTYHIFQLPCLSLFYYYKLALWSPVSTYRINTDRHMILYLLILDHL